MSANESLGRQWHPNVDTYRSGGMGHLPGDPEHSVVGFVHTDTLARYRTHDGMWGNNLDHDAQTIQGIHDDIKAGRGIRSPLHLDYAPRLGMMRLGEGNHRLAAAQRAGAPVVPVRVSRLNLSSIHDDTENAGWAPAPRDLRGTLGGGREYVPSDIHPDHFFA